jgi:maltodextrin utilization protein YvdJ
MASEKRITSGLLAPAKVNNSSKNDNTQNKTAKQNKTKQVCRFWYDYYYSMYTVSLTYICFVPSVVVVVVVVVVVLSSFFFLLRFYRHQKRRINCVPTLRVMWRG